MFFFFVCFQLMATVCFNIHEEVLILGPFERCALLSSKDTVVKRAVNDLQTNWPQYGVYAGINKFRHDLVHTKIINRSNNINKKTNLQCIKVIIVIIKHSLFNTQLEYIASKTQKYTNIVNMIISQRTFVILILFGISSVRSETKLKTGEYDFWTIFFFTKIIISEYHLVKRLSDDSFVLLWF